MQSAGSARHRDWDGGYNWTQRFYHQWTTRDATAAFARARKIAIWTRPYAVSFVLSEIFRRSPDEALAVSARIPAQDMHFSIPPLDFIEPGYVLKKLDTIKALPESSLRSALLAAAALEKKESDPAAALEIASHIKDPSIINWARGRIGSDWADTDQAAARRYVETVPDGPARHVVAVAIGTRWADIYPGDIIDWIVPWTAGEERRTIVNKALAALEKTDPVQAAAKRAALPLSLRPVLPP